MSAFTVYGIPGSPFTRSVIVALMEKSANFRFVAVAPAKLRTEHLARHPFGRVPAIEHDGFPLYETQAILRYIDRVQPGPALTPADPRAAARMDQVMNVSDWYLFLGVNNVIGFQRLVAPRLLGMAADEPAIAAAMPAAQAVFAQLSHLLGEQDYFCGRDVTLADLMVGPQLDMLAQTPEWAALTAGRANLVAWLARLQQRASFRDSTWERMAQLAAA